MKKIFTLFFAAIAMTAVHAQVVTVDFEGDTWNALIDNPQYNGALIYSADEYKWSDANTSLSSFCDKADWSAWGYGFGWNYGIAISNYVDAEATSYDKQLSVPVAPASGTNFAIVWDNKSELSFADGKVHAINSIDVINTSYTLSNIKKSYGEGYFFTVTATGTKADGTTATVDIKLAEGETAIEAWTTVDLSSLGAVTKVVFTFDGSDKSSYGVSTPKYFALDNVKVDMTDNDNDIVDFEAESWNALIDDPQYNGALIYSADEYKWTDATTQISSFCDKADWSAWGYGFGWNYGIAISNYVDAEATSYDKQLSVPVSNGSKNFAVVWENKSELSFADGNARIIKSMDVINTSYALANIKQNYGEGYFFTVTATGTKADGTTATVDIKLAEGETAIEAWTTVDLSSLGAVSKVVFTFDGSDKSSYGVSTPKYFALDNIVVDKNVVTAVKTVKASNTNVAPVAYYGINGKKYSTPQKGINIVRMSDGTSKKIIIR